jgi:hypothetical protein
MDGQRESRRGKGVGVTAGVILAVVAPRQLLPAFLALAAFAPVGAAPSPEVTGDLGSGDRRLAHPITLRLEKTPLADVLAALGRQAGVRLTVSPRSPTTPRLSG